MNIWPRFRRAADRRPRTYVPDYGAEARRFRALEDLATELGESEQRWHIYASASTGALVAMPLWDPGKRVILTSPTPEGLRTQMRQAEAEAARSRSFLSTAAARVSPRARAAAAPPTTTGEPTHVPRQVPTDVTPALPNAVAVASINREFGARSRAGARLDPPAAQQVASAHLEVAGDPAQQTSTRREAPVNNVSPITEAPSAARHAGA